MSVVQAAHAALVLEDGRAFVGKALGAAVLGQGEVVFNTAMTGYQEVLTDPSYAGQMVCMTYPLQGNYGVAPDVAESSRPWVRGFVARWACDGPSHHTALGSLHAYLHSHGLPGIHDVDTRALTRHLRTHGALRAVLSHEVEPPSGARLDDLAGLAARVTPLSEQDLVAEVSRREVEEWLEPLPNELRPPRLAVANGITVAVVDYGVKRNILRSLRSRGCRVVVLPHTATWRDVEAVGADGLLLSNGPGDPAVLSAPVELCREALRRGFPVFGICLGHQVLGRAIGGRTGRLPFGHHGANHPVRDVITGSVSITSQNHEFQVLAASLPGKGMDADFLVSHVNLNDDSVEGLASRSLPAFSVQYHPEGCPGPTDSQHLFDEFVEMVGSGRPPLRAMTGRRHSPRPRRVLIIGSGPIVIGQAAEFDYAGTQACKALREEGVETVLVNSNPATIMTDEEVADAVYVEPLTVESLREVIARERPDALLPTLGGQTGLNLAMELHHAGVLTEYGVELLGATAEIIRMAEDREAFKQLLLEIGEPVPPSRVCESLEAALELSGEIGLPLVVRPAYTLGGTGGGFARTEAELARVVLGGLAASPIGQVLVERSLWGWKELEYEVMRDAADTCITVCNMENLDPMGVHTGDSIVVAPAQTLSDREHQMLRSSALRIIRALGIEGGCNIQFALDPCSSTYYVIEVNPRVSRSSALASKATGYPIARVAAKVAAGRQLEEIRNQVTGRTFAAFEPALDYVVVKVPRWPFDKFPGADRRLGTQMKSTGEVMAIERTFEAALVKALRSLEQRTPGEAELGDPDLIERPNDQRVFALLRALRSGTSPAELAARTRIDVWFLERMAHIVETERELIAATAPNAELVRRARRAGLADAAIEALAGWAVAPGRPTYKLVDTCAAEFEAATPYFYSAWEEEDEARDARPAASRLVIGSGPIRIGQGIEFDYCSVHAARAFREAGARAVLVNSNPETVSTDFDTADRLYFEPLDLDSVAQVGRAEAASGACFQFGGQTAVNLAGPVEAAGIPALGTSVDAIDAAEDRRRFAALLESLRIPRPPGETTASLEEAYLIADRIGYPVIVRPSYVLGGRAMRIVRGPSELRRYMEWAVSALPRGTVLIDKYLEGVELETDAVSDGETVLVPGIMEHIERAGVHSGDSMAVYPAPGLSPEESDLVVAHTVAIARAVRVVGLLNIQFVLHRGRLYVLEVNPRASRTVPFLSKVTGVPMVKLACQAALGERLADLGWRTGLVPAPPLVAVKAPVFSMSKLPGVDPVLAPEMKSTGEVMGVGRDLASALYKAFLAAGLPLPPAGPALLSVDGDDLSRVVPIGHGLDRLGRGLLAIGDTAVALAAGGLDVRTLTDDEALAAVRSGEVRLVIATTAEALGSRGVAAEARLAAAERRVPVLSSLDTARALLEASAAADRGLEVRRLGEWRAAPEHGAHTGHVARQAAGTPIPAEWPAT
jgi:carbamoyl-phosphate synthase large subunit